MVRGGLMSWFVVVCSGLMSWFMVVRSGLMSWFVVVINLKINSVYLSGCLDVCKMSHNIGADLDLHHQSRSRSAPI